MPQAPQIQAGRTSVGLGFGTCLKADGSLGIPSAATPAVIALAWPTAEYCKQEPGPMSHCLCGHHSLRKMFCVCAVLVQYGPIGYVW